MKADVIVRINQCMGVLAHRLFSGTADAVFADMFCCDTEVIVDIGRDDLDAHLKSIDAIAKYYEEIKMQEGLFGALHMLHSNSYKVDDDVAVAQWNTHSSWLSQTGENYGTRFGYFRFWARFVPVDGTWKIQKLEVKPLIIFPMWDNLDKVSWGLLKEGGINGLFDTPGVLAMNTIKPEEYILMRNVIGRVSQEGPKSVLSLLSEKSFVKLDISGMDASVAESYEDAKAILTALGDKEVEQAFYRLNMFNAAPVFAVEDETHARAVFMSEFLWFTKGKKNELERIVKIMSGIGSIGLVKEDGVWKISELVIKEAFSKQPMNFELQMERPMMMVREENWPKAPVHNPDVPMNVEDMFAAESILPHWTERLKRGDTRNFVIEHMINDVEEISMGMSGGRSYGNEKVLAHAGGTTDVLENGELALRFPQFHTGGTPVIEMVDEIHIDITWPEYGWGNMGYGYFYTDADTHRKYRPMIGQYDHKFVKDKDTWKMYYFGWKSTIQSIPWWEYDVDDVLGWASKPYTKAWPLPLEES